MHRYCSRDFSVEELERIKALIAQSPTLSRTQISQQTCRMLGWLKPDGDMKEVSCRVAMLRMQANGLISLPPPRAAAFDARRAPEASPATDPQTPITARVDQLPAPSFHLVSKRQARDSRLWNE